MPLRALLTMLMQETGASEDQATLLDIARYLRLTLASAWAEGATGYFWWCTHDIRPGYQARADGVFPKYSLESQRDGRREVGAWRFGEPLFVRARVGKGRFFYLGADVEAALLARYDPWREARPWATGSPFPCASPPRRSSSPASAPRTEAARRAAWNPSLR